jgi:hypothetical protein
VRSGGVRVRALPPRRAALLTQRTLPGSLTPSGCREAIARQWRSWPAGLARRTVPLLARRAFYPLFGRPLVDRAARRMHRLARKPARCGAVRDGASRTRTGDLLGAIKCLRHDAASPRVRIPHGYSKPDLCVTSRYALLLGEVMTKMMTTCVAPEGNSKNDRSSRWALLVHHAVRPPDRRAHRSGPLLIGNSCARRESNPRKVSPGRGSSRSSAGGVSGVRRSRGPLERGGAWRRRH